MKALRLAGSAPNFTLSEQEISRPSPSAGEVLVRVRAAAVTPTELLWYPTSHTKSGEPRSSAIPSHEFSGEIVECGDGDTGFSLGEEVYGMNDWFGEGALAEYCLT